MTAFLFIKTSSLGDVIHHMPALTEARRHRPDARLAWVVERAFAPLVRLHPAVDEVIAVDLRGWRHAPMRGATWRQARAFAGDLRRTDYDAVIDAQGLLKSAVLARVARGVRHGYDRDSITERAASWFYDVRHTVSRAQHAVARNRRLTALALGYEPAGDPDYGLDRAALTEHGQPYGVLLHATARADKRWSEEHWRALTAQLGEEIDLVLPWGSADERQRAERIAQASPRARLPERMPIDAMARLIAGASFVIGVDTGLLHLAAALGVPLVALFVASDPGLTGPVGRGPIATIGANGAPPSLAEAWSALERVRAGI